MATVSHASNHSTWEVEAGRSEGPSQLRKFKARLQRYMRAHLKKKKKSKEGRERKGASI